MMSAHCRPVAVLVNYVEGSVACSRQGSEREGDGTAS